MADSLIDSRHGAVDGTKIFAADTKSPIVYAVTNMTNICAEA
jgi:hypothetical protein